MRRPLYGAAALAALLAGCTDRTPDALTGPSGGLPPALSQAPAIHAALAVQHRHTPALMRIPGVVGTAVALLPDGRVGVKLLLADGSAHGLPTALDGIPVATLVTGMFMARSNPTTRQRPAPMGYSVGHPAITAGSIGARVVDGSGNVYVLSNNHVLANSNDAAIGDPALQPGSFDGGTSADRIGTLFAFQSLDFSGGNNTIDAAIALSTTSDLGNATPADDGYGAPNAAIFGDANGDGMFDDVSALLGLNVEKYGRTTKLTHGQVTGINVTVDVCYEVLIVFCAKSARFVDQLLIEAGTFSAGGDSGSLIVSDDANRSPVGLLFAGSSTQTIANRIDLVLTRFGVRVDGGEPPPPPTPLTDIAITHVSAPVAVTQGATVIVAVTVRNVGNQDVSAGFVVTLEDTTENALIGTQGVSGLPAGASATLTFAWNTAGRAIGSHTLIARQGFADENATNDLGVTTVALNAPSTGIHVGDLDGMALRSGNTWSATVEIAMHDANHVPLNGATVVGHWNITGQNSDTCTTGDLGGNGTCIVLFPGLRRQLTAVYFTVLSVTMPGQTYDRTANHDPDGSSSGTQIKVNRP
jgi:CARDB protein